jgi:hypothetical protein
MSRGTTHSHCSRPNGLNSTGKHICTPFNTQALGGWVRWPLRVPAHMQRALTGGDLGDLVPCKRARRDHGGDSRADDGLTAGKTFLCNVSPAHRHRGAFRLDDYYACCLACSCYRMCSVRAPLIVSCPRLPLNRVCSRATPDASQSLIFWCPCVPSSENVNDGMGGISTPASGHSACKVLLVHVNAR